MLLFQCTGLGSQSFHSTFSAISLVSVFPFSHFSSGIPSISMFLILGSLRYLRICTTAKALKHFRTPIKIKQTSQTNADSCMTEKWDKRNLSRYAKQRVFFLAGDF